MLIIAVSVRLKIGTPFIFRQVRPGLHGKPFTIYKFRTMTDKRGEDGNLLPDSERLTRLRQFLRMTSMDELSIPVKVGFDEYYYKNKSFLLDLKILFLTFFKVMRSEGVEH